MQHGQFRKEYMQVTPLGPAKVGAFPLLCRLGRATRWRPAPMSQELVAMLLCVGLVGGQSSVQPHRAPGSMPSDAKHRSPSATRFVLLPASEAILVPNAGTWRPTKADIDGLEARLQELSRVKAEDRSAGQITVDHPRQYFRQYVAVIREGRKLIFVNAFCDEVQFPDWHQRLVVVFDGGSCYWQALYEPATHRFSALLVH
jgi:hypothetical protein